MKKSIEGLYNGGDKNVELEEKMKHKIAEMTLPDGNTRRVREVDFSTIKEEWNEYLLEDGIRVKFKPIVARILEVLDDKGEKISYHPSGEPYVLVQSKNELVASEGD